MHGQDCEQLTLFQGDSHASLLVLPGSDEARAMTVTSGLKRFEAVRSRISLRPYRTFTEVEQPESEFILRLDDEGRVGIIEADGGAWKMTAKANIAAYFETTLSEEVRSGSVVVML